MPAAPEVSIVIPCLNEAACAASYPAELFAPLEASGLSCELIFSDGGSTDGTPEAVEAAAAGRPWVSVLRPGGQRPFAASLAAALPRCRGEYVAFMEADLSFSPFDVPRLLAAARRLGCDCVCGSPFRGSFEGLPPARRLLTGAANLLLRLRFGRGVTSYTQIFKLYRAEALRALTFESSGFAIDAELLAKTLARGGRVAEIPVSMRARSAGGSKLALAAETLACLRLLLKGVEARA